jgi:hypothetical protein
MKGIVLNDLLNESKTEEAPKLKPIEYVACLQADGSWRLRKDFNLTEKDQSHLRHILLEKGYFSGVDDLIMVIGTVVRNELYRGKWNDGVTE